MLVWINGPFGGGKTQTAFEIKRRLPGSIVCDPETVGFGLNRMVPRELRGDFQDFPAWRQGVFEVLDRVVAGHPGPVIAPMTVVEPDYFAETVGRLRERGHDVRHFTLLAERETVLRRLSERGVGQAVRWLRGTEQALRRESFAVRKLDRCLEQLVAPEFAEHLWTDRIPVPRVAERIAASAGLPLGPAVGGPVRRRAQWAWTGLTHIRFD